MRGTKPSFEQVKKEFENRGYILLETEYINNTTKMVVLMKNNVIIADDRKPWMIKEDREMACLTRCYLHKVCASRHGMDCKRLGGDVIPKIRG